MSFQWILPSAERDPRVDKLRSLLGVHEFICRRLVSLGIEEFEQARQFFNPRLEDLHSPLLMKDMSRAVERINAACEEGQKIMIYGDYDVDGTTAVSLLYDFLKTHYQNLITYIPDRYREGYGVSRQGIDKAIEEKVSLIIALDCGIKAVDKVEYALKQGIDFIICDHHTPGDTLPPAYAILNPKQRDCNYPFKELSGCGVGLKLVQALCCEWQIDDSHWHRLLDLAAVSIGADIVSLSGENRILAHFGLKKINESPRPAIAALLKAAGKENQKLTIGDVVFLLGPRINAAGRMYHGSLAVELLTSNDQEMVEQLSKELNEHNTERQKTDRQITTEALQQIEEELDLEAWSTVVFHPQWHKGVIGIVASRLIENHYRPTVVFTEKKGVLTGSARSVEGFDLYAALEKCPSLEQFGGHKAAAGMTLAKERLNAFKQEFERAVRNSLKPEQRKARLLIDGELKARAINRRFYNTMMRLAPFGPDNLPPLFVSHHLENAGSRPVGEDDAHLKLRLRDPESGFIMDGIAFRMGKRFKELEQGKALSVVYHLEINRFRDQEQLQWRVLDFCFSERFQEAPSEPASREAN